MDGLDSLQGIQQQKLDILQGNKERVQKQHDDGKSAARERIAKLLDAGSFVETDAFKTEGNVVCGYGTVAERPAYVFAQDFTSQGGAFGTAQAEKILKTLDLAELTGAPVIALL
ncbi:MAG: methylmalonyl-CoA carboxyltransferase, partial [Clostridia bacterium]|nr:methylmalonyl-CoA carboxyltransferase [Clostridia bacterium]